MSEPKPRYATKAKVDHLVRVWQLAEIGEIGSIEFRPDGTIHIFAATASSSDSIDDEIAKWRARRGKS